jgi:hypothetical protein
MINLMIKIKSYQLSSNNIITNEILSAYVTRFWNEVFAPLVSNNELKHLMILCKVQYSDNDLNNSSLYKTLGPLRRAEYKDLDLLTDFLCERLGILIDSYNSQTVSKIMFTYIVKEGEISSKDRLLLQDLTDKKLPSHDFNKIKLPISMNPSDYGKVLAKTVIDNMTRFIVTSNKRVFQFDITLDNLINYVTILGSSDLKWIDTKLSDNSFKREIGKTTIYFFDGEIILQKKVLNAKTFRRLRNG